MDTEIKQKRRPGRYPGKCHQEINIALQQENGKQDAVKDGKYNLEKLGNCSLPNVYQDKPSKIIVSFP